MCQLELAKHITLHANGEPLLNQSSSHSFSPHFLNDDSASCLVCQQQIVVLFLGELGELDPRSIY